MKKTKKIKVVVEQEPIIIERPSIVYEGEVPIRTASTRYWAIIRRFLLGCLIAFLLLILADGCTPLGVISHIRGYGMFTTICAIVFLLSPLLYIISLFASEGFIRKHGVDNYEGVSIIKHLFLILKSDLTSPFRSFKRSWAAFFRKGVLGRGRLIVRFFEFWALMFFLLIAIGALSA